MARIPLVTRDDIPEGEKSAYDAFMQSRGNRPNVGPTRCSCTCRRWRNGSRRCGLHPW